MSIDVIDGTISSATLQRSSRKLSIYRELHFRLKDGGERRLDKVAVAPEVAALLQPGTQGRFYAYKAIDHRGLVAVRAGDGRSAFAVPSGNERIMLLLAVTALAWFLIVLLTRDAIAFLALILAVAGTVGYFGYRKTRIEARRRYEADAR